MTALLPPPVMTEVDRSPAPRSGTAGLGALVLAGLLAVLGLLGSALLLLPSPSVSLTAGTTVFGGSADVVTLPQYGSDGTHVVDYRHGADIVVTVPLRNDGPRALTVTSVATGAGVLPLLEVQDVSGLPLTLAPGEQADVVLRGELGNCAFWHEREIQNIRSLLVAAEVAYGPLRRAADAEVTLDRPLLLHSPMMVGCPDRKVNRELNTRRNAL
jgi:hypothetical protein